MWDNKPDKTYFSTFGGKFTREVPEGTEGAQLRFAEKTNRKIHYLSYDRLTGFVTGIEYRKNDHDGRTYRTLIIDMRSKAGEFSLQLNVFSNACRCFFQVMENIDPAHELRLVIKRSDERDSIFAAQPDALGKWSNLKWNYTKEHPGGKPEWEQKQVQGELRWDNSAEIAWFLEKVPAVHDRLQHNWATAPAHQPAAEPEGFEETDFPQGPPPGADGSDAGDDLPF